MCSGFHKPICKDKITMDKTIDILSYKHTVDKNSIGGALHPDTFFSFRCILGNVYTLGNAMRFLNSTEFNPSWLDKQLTDKSFRTIKRGKGRSITYYWELVTLLLTDRLLADKRLLSVLQSELNEYDNVKFVPKIKPNKGIITGLMVNNKLKTYGVILDKIVPMVLDEYRDMDISIGKLSKSVYKRKKDIVKKKIWDSTVNRVAKRDTNYRLCEGLNETSNITLKETFLK